MKTKILLSFVTILILSVTACTHDSIINIKSENYSQVIIIGNSTNGFSDKESRTGSIEQIPAGDSIVFFSTGGIKAEGNILNYENGLWTGLEDNKWYAEEGPANITAYYPVIKGIDDLYHNNGELRDIVYCKDTFNNGETINLTFNHIFAKLTINIDKKLNDNIVKVHINVPLKVNAIDLKTAEYSVTTSTEGTISFDRNDDGRYEAIIPAKNGMDLSIRLEGNDLPSEDIKINETEFNSGYEYICKVRKDEQNGIYTTEDFIAFTHLINGEPEYEGKSLEDFYSVIDGKRVFNLYNDLSFTDEEADKIAVIEEFNDIFDGNNHTISNLKIKTRYRANFCLIDKNNGEIKNLTIDKCTFDYPEFNNATAGCLFVNHNYGIIDNFHLINGLINMKTDEERKTFGGLSFLNKGTIVNSSISNLILGSNNAILGIFVYQNDGNILNCRINNNINKNTTSKYSACISRFNTGYLYNILITEYKSSYYGICYDNKGIFNHCIIHKNYEDNGKLYYKNPYSESCTYETFSDIEVEKENLANLLNSWIEENQSNYPNITFRKWTTDPTDKVIFE